MVFRRSTKGNQKHKKSKKNEDEKEGKMEQRQKAIDYLREYPQSVIIFNALVVSKAHFYCRLTKDTNDDSDCKLCGAGGLARTVFYDRTKPH